MSISEWFVSVDDHVVEPPSLWQDRLPRRYRDQGPRVERKLVDSAAASIAGGVKESPGPRWADVWCYEDLEWPLDSSFAAVSMDRDSFRPGPITYDEIRPGCSAFAPRLADMDRNGMLASLSFPTFPRFCGQTFLEAKDHDLALLCIRAFNDWMIEEWADPSGGRLMALTLVPLWDPVAGAAEVRRTAAAGSRAVAFSEMPAKLGLPSIHDADRSWDPLFEACAETGSVLAMHIGSSSTFPLTSTDAPASVAVTLTASNSMWSLADFLWSGVLDRFPALNLVYAEAQAGWIPYILERADKIWDQERTVSARGRSYHKAYKMEAKHPPSFYYYRQVYACLFDDEHALTNLEAVGEDNVLFEVDYPHIDSTWPNTGIVVDRAREILTEDQSDKLLRRNAVRLFDLDIGAHAALQGTAT